MDLLGLKACPFCCATEEQRNGVYCSEVNRSTKKRKYYSTFTVTCCNCGSQGPSYERDDRFNNWPKTDAEAKDRAILEWNTRGLEIMVEYLKDLKWLKEVEEIYADLPTKTVKELIDKRKEKVRHTENIYADFVKNIS